MSDAIPDCPRCHVPMREIEAQSATIDRCERCQGTFFDQGEMFAALGTTADTSYWDRPDVVSPVREGKLACPRCHARMLAQDVRHENDHAEIDRCARCQGIWLDPGEAERLMAIGGRMVETVLAEKRRARESLDRMGDVDLRPPGLIFRFLSLFKSA